MSHDRAFQTGLAAAPPLPEDSTATDPAVLESYVRAAMHRDRTPGILVAVYHPMRMYRVPEGLLDAIRAAGWIVELVPTARERGQSIRQIRDALLAAKATGRPLDVVVISGDGTLDHHVLMAAFLAFYPNLVVERPGEIKVSLPTDKELNSLYAPYKATFLSPLPDNANLDPTEGLVQRLWVLRSDIAPFLQRQVRPARISYHAQRDSSDPLLKLAVFAALLPHRVTLRPHGFDLSGLAEASRGHTFQGLYPFIRSIAVYPAGTAADNALYAGVPGWTFARFASLLSRFEFLAGFKQRWETRLIEDFLRFFSREGVVVPARFSVVSLDGDWQLISSHAAGGPAAGRFFEADLSDKTSSLLGYLKRIPGVVFREGLFESGRMRIVARMPDGRTKAHVEGRLIESLYTNRTFIAGVGTVPSTNPTSFAGQSSLVVIPPIFCRTAEGRDEIDFSGVLSFAEAIVKGLLARLMHGLGLHVGRLAGGGRFALAAPQHQLTLGEGESVEIEYLDDNGKPRFVPTQVSGDPFQACRMQIRVAWGPLPLLADPHSLLLAAAQRSLTRLRQQQAWNLDSIFIGGWPFYRHIFGSAWTPQLAEETGLFAPPHHLPRSLEDIQQTVVRRWQSHGTGAFVDTTEQGLSFGRRGRYAHNSDQTAHLMVLREAGGSLLVRQVRHAADGAVYEARTRYRSWWGGWVIHESQVRVWRTALDARLLQEEHFLGSEEEFGQEAPGFFPFIRQSPDEPVWPEITEEVEPPE